ncbi:MAG: hypothetical protein KAJ07_00470 [Planctomycetes bacterium]|nr:hypothetical protein [Planctomycetota bacterium]
MTQRIKIPFVGPAYESKSKNVNAQRSVNLYLETGGFEGKSSIALYGTPGLELFATLGGDGVRGEYHPPSKNLFAVSGNTFYEVNRAGVVTERGTLNSSSGRVSMVDNGTQIMIVDGVDGYIYNLDTTAFVQITDSDFPGADTVTFVDGYFAVNKPDTGRWHVSALLDGLSWDATDFTTAESSPDELVAVLNIQGTVHAFGRYTTEIYYNSAAVFPFDRISGGIMKWGIEARFSLSEADNTAFWLGRNLSGGHVVLRKQGYDAIRVSDHAVEEAMDKMSTVSDAFSYSYTSRGHTFYVLTFPTGNQTWVLDITTGLWHERQSYKEGGSIRHRANAHFYFIDEHIVGDFESGKLYKMRDDVLTDDGDPIERIRRTQRVTDREKNIVYSRLEVDMETGVGLSTSSTDETEAFFADGSILADGSKLAGDDSVVGGEINPAAMLRWSDDGGHTWSNEKWRSMGKKGEYGKRVVWNRLGFGRDRIWELKITDPVKVVIIGAVADIEVMAA